MTELEVLWRMMDERGLEADHPDSESKFKDIYALADDAHLFITGRMLKEIYSALHQQQFLTSCLIRTLAHENGIPEVAQTVTNQPPNQTADDSESEEFLRRTQSCPA